MAKINSLRDIIQFNSNFKTAINLYLSLNKAEKVLGYIPTKSSVSFLGEYLKAVLENKEQATLLVGPYGKGKSHLLLVLLAVLSMKKTPESESAINELIDNVSKTDEVGERVSEYIGQVWDKKRFLPVLITDTTGDLNQAFLYGLNDALKRDGLLDLAPETYYSIALDRIDDWEQNYFETYKMFERELTQNGMSIAELKTDLKQYSQKTLILFKEIYPKVTAGSEFNPMALADALPLYKSVSEKLVDEYGYSGIYIVFDEFSKFIEGQNNIAAGTNMHLLQSMCELATDSKNAQVFITMVAHKSIKEYSLNLDMPSGNESKYESASANIVAIAGLNAALESLDQRKCYEHEKELTKYLIERLSNNKKVKMYLPNDLENHIGIVSLTVDGFSSEDIGIILDEDFDIAVRTGYHCAPYIHKYLKDETQLGTVRVGIGQFNTKKEIDLFVKAIEEIVYE